MPYVTQSQLEDRFGSRMLVDLTDRAEAPVGEIDQDTLAGAVSDATAIIDGHISARYTVPVLEVPQLLTSIAADLVIYALHRYEPDPKIVRDHDKALLKLRMIAEGKIRLEIEGRPVAEVGGSGARKTDRERPMTAENLKGYI